MEATEGDTKRRKRREGEARAGESAAGGSSGADSGMKVKKKLDIDALKKKLAEDKMKLERLKMSREQEKRARIQVTHMPPLTSLADSYQVERTVPSNVVNLRYQQEEMMRKLKKLKREERLVAKMQQSRADGKQSAGPDKQAPQVERKRKVLSFLEPEALARKTEGQMEEILQMKLVREKQRSMFEEIGQGHRVRPKPTKIPDVEWWDLPYIVTEEAGQEESGDKGASSATAQLLDTSKLKTELITNVIEHPELTYPQAEPPLPPPPPIMLTRAEQKRISVHDPTAVERKVRAEMAARVSRHEARNNERKLTPEQRKEKEKAKLVEDTSLKSNVAVFKVLSLANPRNRFKIDIEANKNLLTGCVILSDSFALVVVEGGPKAVKRYKKLMTKKIKWTEEIPPPKNPQQQQGPDEKDDKGSDRVLGANIPPSENKCWLIWEGEVLRRAFINFRFETLSNKPRKSLEKLGIAHYWDLALNYQAKTI
ncbi:uncharacterized protein LOC126317008 [Schistocerca gregaria]|uniref:uncharacterized protein LOC126317008 n=1 Tax=Schistocerca gregaria TaxID=7010 RepID=UPI00211DDC64|nr:uncharacterized protein LOC126317008 [Schistocerca gregaria]